MPSYVTGTGQTIWVHNDHDCRGPYCVIHNPSKHHMVDWPTHWRPDRYLMERICPHGVGHPDPDHIAFTPRGRRHLDEIHGCDGCCQVPGEPCPGQSGGLQSFHCQVRQPTLKGIGTKLPVRQLDYPILELAYKSQHVNGRGVRTAMKKQPKPKFGPKVLARRDNYGIEFRRTEDRLYLKTLCTEEVRPLIPKLAKLPYEKWVNVQFGPIRVTKAK